MTEPTRPAPIVLVGLMGSGKSTVGRLVAARLQRPFVDLDDVVVEQTGRSVAELFAVEGEGAFRRYEADALGATLARPDGPVVATGGGVVTTPANRNLLAGHVHVVWLRAQPSTLAGRTGADATTRPLLAGVDSPEATLSALADARVQQYTQVATSVIDTDGLDVQSVAGAVVDRVAVHS